MGPKEKNQSKNLYTPYTFFPRHIALGKTAVHGVYKLGLRIRGKHLKKIRYLIKLELDLRGLRWLNGIYVV